MKKNIAFCPTEKGINNLLDDMKNGSSITTSALRKEISDEIAKPINKMDVALIDENVGLWVDATETIIPEYPKPHIPVGSMKTGVGRRKKCIRTSILVAAVLSIIGLSVQATGTIFDVNVFGGLIDWAENKIIFKTEAAFDADKELSEVRNNAAACGINDILLPGYAESLISIKVQDAVNANNQIDFSVAFTYKRGYVSIIASQYPSEDTLPQLTLQGEYSSGEIITNENIDFYVISQGESTSVMFISGLTVYQLYTDFSGPVIKNVLYSIH